MMGCDIHAHIEYRDNGRWVNFSSRLLDRNYYLFGLLAGVRGENAPVVAPRGYPVDAAFWTQEEYMEWDDKNGLHPSPDWHTASWLTTDELKQIRARYNNPPFRVPLYLDGAIAAMEVLPEARLVFWFDN